MLFSYVTVRVLNPVDVPWSYMALHLAEKRGNLTQTLVKISLSRKKSNKLGDTEIM